MHFVIPVKLHHNVGWLSSQLPWIAERAGIDEIQIVVLFHHRAVRVAESGDLIG